MKAVKLPRKHFEDFENRFDDEDVPTPIEWLNRQVVIDVTDERGLRNLFEDALYYSDVSGRIDGLIGLRNSARRTAEILAPLVPLEWGKGLRKYHPTLGEN